MNKVYQVAVLEFESDWGSKVDDYMVCMTIEDCLVFTKEFNSKNTFDIVPNWYMVASSDVKPIEITNSQYQKLQTNKKVWLSQLKNE